MYFSSPALDHGDDLSEGVLVLFEEVGDDYGHAPAHPHHAVHQHVALPPRPLDELICLLEVLVDRVILPVLGGDVEVVGDVCLPVGDEPAACH